jgi:phthiocerol/phenolphthiocerol synthesis type-I polyketide synthase E
VDSGNGSEIAIVGMNCRFPGAVNVESFWENLVSGRESITFFDDNELAEAGIESSLLKNKKYVKAGSILEDIDKFDASFFGFTPREAEILDPQQRLFLENCWEALELAGYTSEKYHGRIGVYAGVFTSSYLLNIYSHPNLVESVGEMSVRHGNEKDYLATRVSYKLNLKGPSVNVQTSCSTALVAVHVAIQSLLGGECDMALAGGASIIVPQKAGYLYLEGGILTPDGHCRPFDAKAKGTIFGSGVGVVVLKRLDDALKDGDTIHAVIKGSAINNDGSDKVGFIAPSLNGQVEVISDAMAMAGVDPSTIGMIEAHGTGTPLGDPIEIAALTRVFRAETDSKNYCAIGSVKSNIGHLGAASGIAGLIKAVLCLKHKTLVPSLHFEDANPNINFEDSPFCVNTQLREWKNPTDVPRRAGVSSFGMGGTNAHVVLEEISEIQEQSESVKNTEQLIVLSARTDVALAQALVNLRNYLECQINTSLEDGAYTLQVGRREFEQRAMFVAQSREEALEILSHPESRKLLKGSARNRQRIAFIFPGQGSQYVDMARGLYESEMVFRQTMDFCSDFLSDTFGLDIRSVLYDTADAQRHEKVNQTSIAQPALFAVEYSLVQLLDSWEIKPDTLLGHSVGEYVAACIAGVFSLEDALRVVAIRGQLMQRMPEGDMLSVHLPESSVRDLINGSLSIAAVNAPELCVVAGSKLQIELLRVKLETDGIKAQLLHTSHAFHSSMMDPILEEFAEQISQVRRQAPSIPFISNLTGKSIQVEEVMDPWYWAHHLRHTVQFATGLNTLLEDPNTIVLEVGPGQSLTGLIRQHPNRNATHTTVALCRHPKDQQSDSYILKQAIGRLWLEGVPVLWESQWTEGMQKCRIPLPTYPFERKRYWIERLKSQFAQAPTSVSEEFTVNPLDGAESTEQPSVPSESSIALNQQPASNDELTELEQQIIHIWEELFGIQSISLDDNFFELNGNSLLAIQLMSQVREKFGIEIELESMFDDPTVAGLVGQVTVALELETEQQHV